MNENKLLSILQTGKHNGQTAETLGSEAGVAPAAIPVMVNQLQHAGHLVVEDEGHYFIAENPDEWREYRTRCFISVAVDMAQRHRAMSRSAARRWPRQWTALPSLIIGEAA